MTELTTAEMPRWLVVVSAASVALGLLTAAALTVDVLRRPPRMAVMAVVWPVTALFGSLMWAAAYLRWGRAAPRAGRSARPSAGHDGGETPMPVAVFTGTSHCGAGCTLGDLLVEWLVVAAPALAVAGGAGWLFDDELFAVWVLAYVAAFLIGIGFQYFAIAPMRRLSLRDGLRAAVKADALSITAWQLGMYGTMALVQLVILPATLGGRAAVTTPVFWAAMQVAMIVGFLTAYPVNWWLIRSGVKERM